MEAIWLLLKTKVFWFNVLALLILVANGFGFADFQADPAVAQWALVLTAFVNIVAGFFNKRAAAQKK